MKKISSRTNKKKDISNPNKEAEMANKIQKFPKKSMSRCPENLKILEGKENWIFKIFERNT